MKSFRSGFCTDVGRVRTKNEDRLYVDNEHGIFLVADGVGGQAAGELAAEVAIDVIRAQLNTTSGDLKNRIRQAITQANNTIFAMAQNHDGWQGMACVLTLAAFEEDRVAIGHVGDSRLYLIWNGAMRKLTSDHSPVGELEERGELTEQEAMLHPRRNEVFRDVGSKPRQADEEDFIELKEFPFKPDAAILLCSDGLSDVLTSTRIREIVERYAGEPETTARELVAAANEAGGADNITAVLIAGPEFLGSGSDAMAEARERHAITRTRQTKPERPLLVRIVTSRVAFLIYGLILGLLFALRWK